MASLVVAWALLLPSSPLQSKVVLDIPTAAIPFLVLLTIVLIHGLSGHVELSGVAWTAALYLAICLIWLTYGMAPIPRAPAESIASNIRWRLKWFAAVVLFASVVSTGIALCQSFELWENQPWLLRMPYLRRPGANLGQSNHLASLLVMGMVAICYLHARDWIGRGVSGLIIVFLCFGLAVTQSRTGVLSAIALALFWTWKRGAARLPGSGWLSAFLVVLIIALFTTWPLLFDFLIISRDGAINTRLGLETKAGDLRLIVWPQIWSAVMEKPWLGWGIMSTSKAHAFVIDRYTTSDAFSFSHNLVLDFCVWFGIPATIAFIVVSFAWLLRRLEAVNSPEPWFCLALAVPFAVHSMLEFPFTYAYFLVPVMMALGMLDASLEINPILRIDLLPAKIVASLLTLLIAWSGLEYIRAEDEFRVVRFRMLNVGQLPMDHTIPKLYVLNQLDSLLASARIEVTPSISEEDIDLLRKVAEQFPWAGPQYRYALGLALIGRIEQAQQQLDVLRIRHGDFVYERILQQYNRTIRSYNTTSLTSGKIRVD